MSREERIPGLTWTARNYETTAAIGRNLSDNGLVLPGPAWTRQDERAGRRRSSEHTTLALLACGPGLGPGARKRE